MKYCLQQKLGMLGLCYFILLNIEAVCVQSLLHLSY